MLIYYAHIKGQYIVYASLASCFTVQFDKLMVTIVEQPVAMYKL